jgi:hypothetical protein
MKKTKLWLGLGLGCGAFVLICIVGVVFLVMATREAGREADARDRANMERVSAEELVADYRANEVAADGRYRNYLAEINGTVDRVGRDLTGGEYVTLRSASGLWQVQCFASSDQTFAGLRPGQQVTLSGRVQGKFGNVLVKDCRTL